ncbi:MAG: FkbM family methyltransferase [Actinomycetota bacterium]
MTDRLKDINHRIQRSSPARTVGRELLTREYAISPAGGSITGLIDRALVYVNADKAERNESVEATVDLFFQLAMTSSAARFLEVGAKEATASVRAAKTLGIDDVRAFEANPYTYERFAKHHADTGVDYQHLAVGEEVSTIEFNVRLTDQGQPRADGQGSMLRRSNYKPGYVTASVECVPLDEVLRGEPAVPTAMWIDVEGASSAVLRGAVDTLRSVVAIIIEVETRRVWDQQEWLHLDIVRFLAEHGLVPVARDRQSRHQFNVVFVPRGSVDDRTRERLAEWRKRVRRARSYDDQRKG